MNPDRPDTSATDVYQPVKSEIPTPRPFGHIDVTDADQVAELAFRLRNAGTRTLQAVTTAEVKALAALAAKGAIALSQGLVLIDALDAAGSHKAMRRQLDVFASHVRPLQGES
jgi:hypothetical protein